MADKTWFENLKNAIGQWADAVITQMQERAAKLYKEFGWDKATTVFSKMKEEYVDAKQRLNGKAQETAHKITGELDQLVQEAKPKENKLNSNMAPWAIAENKTSIVNNGINQASEKSDKNLFTLEKSLEQIPSESRLSKLYPQYNKAAESLKNIEWLDNLQAAALVYVHNGINAGENIKHPLKAQWELKLATILTVELLAAMKGKEGQLLSMTEKLSSNTASKKIWLDHMIVDGTKSIKESWIMDQIGWFTSLIKGFSEAKPILEKANTMLELLRNGSSNFEAETMTSDQLEQLYHLCINRSFPKAEDIARISSVLWEAQRQEAKLKTLWVSQTLVSFFHDHLKELSFIDPANQEKTQELAQAAEQGVDAVYDIVWQWFGAEKWSAMMDQWIESLMKFFDNPFLWALANMAGIDLSAIRQTISGEFTPTQEEEFSKVIDNYQDATPVNAQRVARLSWWMSDRTSERFKLLEKFNIKHLEDNLWKATPHVDVVKTLIGEDEALKTKYLEKTTNNAWEEVWKLKSGADYTELAKLYCANDVMIKSVVDSTKLTNTSDVVWLLTAQWMKWDIRWVRAWTKYQEKQAKNNTTKETEEVSESSPKWPQWVEAASWWFAAKLDTRYIANTLPVWLLSKNFIDLSPPEIKQVMHEFFDQWKYATQVDEVCAYIKTNPVAWLVEMFIGLAEHKDGYDNPQKTNKDPNLGSGQKNYWAFQISTTWDPVVLAHKHFTEGIKRMNITGSVNPDSRLWQLIGHLGWHIGSKWSLWDLLSLKVNSSPEQFHTIIKDKIQIGWDGFKTDVHVYKMLHSKVWDMFELPQTA